MRQDQIYEQRAADSLAAKIQGRNQCHDIANKLEPVFKAALAPFAGKKIANVGGVVCDKVRKVCAEAVKAAGLPDSYYWSSARYSLYVTVKVCTTINDRSHYAEQGIYLGDMIDNSHDFKAVAPPMEKPFRTDYTKEEIQRLRAELRAVQDRESELKSALSYFGEHDSF